MKILSIDTSAIAASVAIAEEDKIIGEFFINTSLTHSQTLMPMVEQLCKNVSLSLDNIDAIAVNAGPGSFTGVRIGVAAVKGLAFANNIKCISVSTLESLAYNLSGNECIACAVMDARCSQVYNALFKISAKGISRICDDRALSITDLEKELKKYNDEIILIGDGADITFNMLDGRLSNVCVAPINNKMQRASSVAMVAFEKADKGEYISAEELMPVYLRLPQAQRELNKRMGV